MYTSLGSDPNCIIHCQGSDPRNGDPRNGDPINGGINAIK